MAYGKGNSHSEHGHTENGHDGHGTTVARGVATIIAFELDLVILAVVMVAFYWRSGSVVAIQISLLTIPLLTRPLLRGPLLSGPSLGRIWLSRLSPDRLWPGRLWLSRRLRSTGR